MKVYFEFIFVINFLLDFMLLYGTKKVLKLNKKIYRLLFGSTIGSLTTFLLFIELSNIELLILKTIISSAIILVSFGKDNYLKNLFYFYLISIILGGTIYLFDLNSNYYFNFLILLTVSPIIIYLIVKELIAYKNTYSNKYEVLIYIKNKKYSLEGFIDTGNRVESLIKKEPVILVNLKIPAKNVIYVPFKTLDNEGVISCIRPDKVLVGNKEFNHCLIGLAKDKFQIDGVNCILPNKFKEEL
ncbi:MAG: hypothetical protein HFE81_01780 [Bacilli bacterium]|nr:hypothetical protein [Bacilli bacterium]